MFFRLMMFSLLISLSFTVARAADNDLPTPQRTLVLLNWSEYMDPELIARFEQTHNVKVSEIYFEGDDLRDDMLLETEGQGYDVVLASGDAVERYRQRGWLASLDLAQIPNYSHIDEYWVDAFPGARGYAVPYFWGTLGIAYRSDLVSKPPRSWMDLLTPDEQVRGKIGMIESSRDLMTVALKARGYSANSTDKAEIGAAENLLIAQKPYVKTYVYLSLTEQSALVSGDILMTMIYSGDALMLREHHDAIEYVVPEEGSNIWVDYLVVMQNSPKKDLAWTFINFLNEPENAAHLAEYVYYATPNKSAEKLLPEDFLSDPVIYPDKQSLSKSEFHLPLPPRALKRRNLAISHVMD